MLEQLVVVHKSREKAGGLELAEPNQWFLWKTCLREIAIGSALHLPKDGRAAPVSHEYYQAEDAYIFLLEVACGLHSPILGETEVFGQFKQSMEDLCASNITFDFNKEQLRKCLLQDAKKIRCEHLIGLGSNSYGSLIRRYLRNFDSVHVLGAGALVVDILPWLNKEDYATSVFCRNLEKTVPLQKEFPAIEFLSLEKMIKDKANAALVVAAPLSSEDLKQYIDSYKLLIDLRGEAQQDPLRGLSLPYIPLQELLSEIESHQEEGKVVVQQAILAVKQNARKRFERSRHIPFGWDDVCA